MRRTKPPQSPEPPAWEDSVTAPSPLGQSLTLRQSQFLSALLGQVLGERPTLMRPTAAAVSIGVPPEQAASWSKLVMSAPAVKEALHGRLRYAVEASAATPVRWLAEVARLALVEPPTLKDFYLPDGSMRPPHEWTPEMAAEVAEYQSDEIWEGNGEERAFKGHTRKIKLQPRKQTKTQALEMLAKYHKLIVQTLEVVGKDGKDLFPADQDAQDNRARERRVALLAALGPVSPEVAIGLH